MSYTLLLQQATILKPILESPCPESVLTFKSLLHLWWEAEVDGAPRLYLKLDTLKKQVSLEFLPSIQHNIH